MSEKDPARTHFWFINILQFFFGGLLSAFLVFYFRSGTLAASWPFFLILAAAFAANESLKKHYARLSFQISFFFLSLFSLAIFLVPILLRRIGAEIFLLSGVVSVIFLILFLLILKYFAEEKFRNNRKILLLSIGGIFLTMNILYFLNLIPPIPLSLKNGGVYHAIVRNANGDYTVSRERQGWFAGFFDIYPNIHVAPDEPLYAYSAIFSPPAFGTEIVHEWQTYDKSNGWITVTRTVLSVSGGREGGYRTYSIKAALTPGKWRVNVETPRGETIGRLRFEVIPVTAKPDFYTSILD